MSAVAHLSVGAELLDLGMRSANLLFKFVHLCARFDKSGEWAVDGSPTAAHWIAAHLDIEVSTAREWIRVGHRLGSLPVIDNAFKSRLLSYSKVRTLTRFATKDNEAELCKIAVGVPAGRLGIALAHWSKRNEDPKTRNMRHQVERYLSWGTSPDGSIRGSFCWPPLAGGRFASAIDAEVMRWAGTKRDASADAWASIGQQRIDALERLLTNGGSSVRSEMIVHLRGDGLSLDDGTPISDSLIGDLIEESFIRALIHDAKGKPINASEKHRYPTDRQKRVIKERDKRCMNCGSTDFLQYDHQPPYFESEHTVVDEVYVLCSKCHTIKSEAQSGR